MQKVTPVDTGKTWRGFTIRQTGSGDLVIKVNFSTDYSGYIRYGRKKKSVNRFGQRLGRGGQSFGKEAGRVLRAWLRRNRPATGRSGESAEDRRAAAGLTKLIQAAIAGGPGAGIRITMRGRG